MRNKLDYLFDLDRVIIQEDLVEKLCGSDAFKGSFHDKEFQDAKVNLAAEKFRIDLTFKKELLCLLSEISSHLEVIASSASEK